jgi:hypothetical protein
VPVLALLAAGRLLVVELCEALLDRIAILPLVLTQALLDQASDAPGLLLVATML